MSSSIIEAKFQQLDRTIRLLNKTNQQPKVASSDQLRQLVYSQRVNTAASKLSRVKIDRAAAKAETSNARATAPNVRVSNQDEQHAMEVSATRPLARPDSSSSNTGARQSSLKSATRPAERAWVDPKLQRAEQILEDAWNVMRCWHLTLESHNSTSSLCNGTHCVCRLFDVDLLAWQCEWRPQEIEGTLMHNSSSNGSKRASTPAPRAPDVRLACFVS